MKDRAWRCSRAAGERSDQLFATASRVTSWLLIEQPGPWGRDALLESRIPQDIGLALHERSHALRLRVILIRRPMVGDLLNVFAVHTGTSRTSPFIEHTTIAHPGEVLEVDLEAITRGRPAGFGERWDEPLYLVCTNGRHDVCCAERGRPLYAAVADELPERAWECSHIGGDRFAGNLVCFPHGAYYGWLGPDAGRRVVSAFERGFLNLELYRGRSSYPMAIQAAERYVRFEHGLLGIDDLTPLERRHLPDGAHSIKFLGPGGRTFGATVRETAGPDAVALTCRAESTARPRRFELVALDAVNPAAL